MTVKLVETPNELEDAYYVRRTVFINEQNVPEEEEIDVHEKESAHFILYQGESPAGAGRFRIVDGYGKVERICVLKEIRGTGAGKEIMQAIEDYARKRGIEKLKLNAQTHAIPFYERLGYQTVSGEFMDAGIPHKTMLKVL